MSIHACLYFLVSIRALAWRRHFQYNSFLYMTYRAVPRTTPTNRFGMLKILVALSYPFVKEQLMNSANLPVYYCLLDVRDSSPAHLHNHQ